MQYSPDGSRLVWTAGLGEKPSNPRATVRETDGEVITVMTGARAPQWLHPDTVQMVGPESTGYTLLRSSPPWMAVNPTGLAGGNTHSAGSGVWAVGRLDPRRVITSWGASISNASDPALSPNGAWLAYTLVDTPQAGVNSLVVQQVGASMLEMRVLYMGAPATPIFGHKSTTLVWADSGRVMGIADVANTAALPQDLSVPGWRCSHPVACWDASRIWVGMVLDLDGERGRLVVSEWGSLSQQQSLGYIVAESGGSAFEWTLSRSGQDELQVAYLTPDGQLHEARINTLGQPVSLEPDVEPEPPEPEPPDPEPEPPEPEPEPPDPEPEPPEPEPEPPQPEPEPEPEPPIPETVSFRTSTGVHLTAEDGGAPEGTMVGVRPGGLLTARSETADAWQTFTLIRLAGGIVALQSSNGFYLCAENGGGRELVARSDVIGPWETFLPVHGEGAGDPDKGDTWVGLRTVDGWYVHAYPDGSVDAKSLAVFAEETFVSSVSLFPPPVPHPEPPDFGPVLRGQIRVDNRMFRAADGGYFRIVGASCLSPLRPGADYLPALDEIAGLGFNMVRVFCGALPWCGQTLSDVYERLPEFLDACASRGLYVWPAHHTEAETGYDLTEHTRRLQEILARRDYILSEVANEPDHPTQGGRLDPSVCAELAEVMAGPVAFGATIDDDESPKYMGGEWGTVHLDRGRDKWNMVRRVREIEAMSAEQQMPVTSGEPIGAADQSEPGKRESDPAIFFCMAALCRLFETGGIFHSTDGLNAQTFTMHQRTCAEAYIRGDRALSGISERLVYYNVGHTGSPLSSAIFNDGVVSNPGVTRAYSGVYGDRGYTVLVGLGPGDPGLVWSSGWQPVAVVDQYPGCLVIDIRRG